MNHLRLSMALVEEYLLMAKTYRPALYQELKNNPNFTLVYQTIRR